VTRNTRPVVALYLDGYFRRGQVVSSGWDGTLRSIDLDVLSLRVHLVDDSFIEVSSTS
jgi:hypothetical protein